MGNDNVQAVSRRRVTVAIAIVAALVVTACGSIGESDDPSVHSGGGSPGEYAHILRLDEGRSGYVAHAYSGNDVEVWWRGAGDASWSESQVIEGGKGRYLTWTNTRLAGTTLAIRAYYNTKAPWDDEGDTAPGVESSVFIVCRPTSCVASDHYEQVQEPPCRRGSCMLSRPESKGMNQVPELSSDGSQVYFGNTEHGYVVWDANGGVHELRPTGLPTDGVLGTPMLAPDGSMRLVSGREVGNECRLTLLTSPPLTDSADKVTYLAQASTTAPTSSGDCATTLEAFTSDQVLAHTDLDVPAYFVRSGDAWSATDEDPTGMLRYEKRPGRQAAGDVERTGYWHWREVMTGSPDGRHIVAQVHFPGEAAWTEPVVVAVAPPGLHCFEIAPTSTPSDEPFYVSMRCRSRPSPVAEWVYVGMHAVTEDGVTWQSAFGDDGPTRVGEDLFFGGAPAHRWTPDDGLIAIGLPTPDNSETFLLDDGTYVLVTALPDGARCRLEVRVAGKGDEQWSAPIPNGLPFIPDHDPCLPVGQYDGKVVSLYFDSYGPMWMAARVTDRCGEWEVEAPRRAGTHPPECRSD